MTVIQRITAQFNKWVGYLEKASNSQLDSMTANGGDKNYTRFSRDYKAFSGINAQGQPWCDVFVDTCFCYEFGAEAAKKMLCGFSAYTPTSANCFKTAGRWYTKPSPGDIIFFKNSERICHTGFVYAVDTNYVYTIEGNTSNTNGLVANGGCVAKKSYSKTYSRIAGYGRPKYELIGDVDMDELNALKQQVNDLVSIINKVGFETAKNQLDVNMLIPNVYNYIDDNMPEWAKPTIQKLTDNGILKGTEDGLGLTDDMLRILVILDRAKIFN